MNKEEISKKRKEAYEKAKRKRDADPRYQEMKEKFKQKRRDEYRAAKEKQKNKKLEEKRAKIREKDAVLLEIITNASVIEKNILHNNENSEGKVIYGNFEQNR